MDLNAEGIIKIVLLAVVFLGVAGCFILPRIKRMSGVKPGSAVMEKLFSLTFIIGLLTGAAGLTTAFLLKDQLFSLHIWELLLIPFFLIHVCYYIIVKSGKKLNTDYDEKQLQDMTRGAAFAWAFIFPVMVGVFVWYQQSESSSLIWFPIFLFGSIMIYSGATLLSRR